MLEGMVREDCKTLAAILFLSRPFSSAVIISIIYLFVRSPLCI